MANRVAGIATITVDGTAYGLRGNFTVSPSIRQREMLAGQDFVHGWREMPRVPFIEGDINLHPQLSIEDLEAIENATVQADLANGRSWVLREATTTAAFELNTQDGTVRVRWEGVSCDEIS